MGSALQDQRHPFAPVDANLGWRFVPTKVGTYQSSNIRHTHADVTSLR
jgi:hypothetical protein